ncbi:MAG: hypothetical protein DRJ50_11780, partial [Actinobacteria bacterium]
MTGPAGADFTRGAGVAVLAQLSIAQHLGFAGTVERIADTGNARVVLGGTVLGVACADTGIAAVGNGTEIRVVTGQSLVGGLRLTEHRQRVAGPDVANIVKMRAIRKDAAADAGRAEVAGGAGVVVIAAQS